MRNSQSYGFCIVETENSDYSGIACAVKNGGRQTVHYYYRRDGKRDVFICDAGCGKHIAQKLILKCKYDDNC
jgi:hypothetical protein